MRTSISPAVAWLATFALATTLGGCQGERPPALVRLAEADGDRVLETQPPYEQRVVFDEKISNAEGYAGVPNPPLFDSFRSFDASTIDLIEVTVEGLPQGQLKVFWRREDEPDFAGDRFLMLQAEHMQGGRLKLFPFAVAEHPEWYGTIVHLRFYTHQDQRPHTFFRHWRASVRAVEPAVLQEALAHTWRANLGQELRNALLGPPRMPIEREMVVPRGAQLRFAYGLQPGVESPVDFRVVVRAGNEEQQLFDARVDPAADGEPTWHEASVNLSRWSGRRVRLRLETHAEPAFDLSRGFPLWGHPEVVGKAKQERPPSVILISIDTLRADHLSLYGYSRETSPRLSRWAAERAVVFRNAISQAPSTLPSHTSMLTGLEAFRHGAHQVPAAPGLRTLAEMLRERGFATLARTGGGYVHPRYGLFQGFDVFSYWLADNDRDRELETGVDQAIDWVDQQRDRPFFLFLHTYEVHGPYPVRQPHFGRLTPDASPPPGGKVWLLSHPTQPEDGFRAVRTEYGTQLPGQLGWQPADAATAIAAYDSAIAHTDAQIGRLLDRLDDLDLADDTLIVFTSDHGEEFGEHGISGHGYLYDSNLRVPLVVALPGRRHAGGVRTEQVRSIDILPTILDALGLSVPDGIDGVSLLPLLDGSGPPPPPRAWSYAANDNHGIAVRVRNRVKYIFNDTALAEVHGREELYELDRDPGEQQDVAARHADVDLLRREVAQTLAKRAAGLRVRLANATSYHLRGELAGAVAAPTQIKAPVLPCPCVHWGPARVIRFEVPPAAAYILTLDGAVEPAAHLRLSLIDDAGRAVAEHLGELPLGQRAEPFAIELTGEMSWRAGAGEQAQRIATGIGVWWQGQSEARPLPAIATEPELMMQLKALGYLN